MAKEILINRESRDGKRANRFLLVRPSDALRRDSLIASLLDEAGRQN